MGKKNSKKIAAEALKIPVILDDYRLKKTTGEMLLTFAVPPEKVDLAKPLLNHVQEPFILLLFRPKSLDDVEMVFNLNPEELQ